MTNQTNYQPPPPLPSAGEKVKVMVGERVVFIEESDPQNYLKLIANGDVDETKLEALEDYVKHQKKRLNAATAFSETGQYQKMELP